MIETIDDACEQFRQSWGRSSGPDIESVLERYHGDDEQTLLSRLLKIEIDRRRARGEVTVPDEYRARFPKATAIVDSVFTDTVLGVEDTAEHVKPTKQVDPYATLVPPDGPAVTGLRTTASQRVIGRYTVLSQLGQGGQASVYRAVHPTLPIEVAIKLTHSAIDSQIRDSLREESGILCDLDHPYIGRVRDFDFDGGRPFMVLDFIRGRSLAQVAATEPLTPEASAVLVSKLADAMAYAHSRGVVHRDLKPENVVIESTGEPKIIDFGMSRLRTGFGGDNRSADEISGTLVYMAPEQALGVSSQTDHRVDIFALGAILYRLLVGKPPYGQATGSNLLHQVREGKWDDAALENSTAPQSLKQVCRRAMATNSADRYQNASHLADALRQLTVEAKSSRVLQSRLVISGCLATVSLTAGLLFVVSLRHREETPLAMSYVPDSGLGAPSVHAPVSSDEDSERPSSTSGLIKRFDLIHIGNSTERAEFSGSLFEFRPPRENDDIQVQAAFNVPVYCFLVALNPDGVKQLCYPEDGDTPQSEPITALRYPAEPDTAFGLTDGAGQQAFVLYTSRDPLPAFNAWESELTTASWPDPDVAGNWLYLEGELKALAQPFAAQSVKSRGVERKTQAPTPFKELCDRLQQTQATDVRGALFEVTP